ncbi:DUF6924 domain-containing protein [Amycolatopsis pigmentata]|uniref:DUF6924 domain-containing protein n=1 Tax=Amycolatopsis pigmentata TaxID=450801 RepID=A0ABW5G0Z7_9PSEU
MRRPVIDRTDHDDSDALVVRVDYSDDDAWRTVVELLNQPWNGDPEIPASNRFVNNHAYAGASPDEVLAAVGEEGPPLLAVFVADEATMRGEHPVLAISTLTREDCEHDEEFAEAMEFGREFRLAPTAITEMTCNLALGNMGFEEFAAQAAEEPGRVFRGFTADRPAGTVPRTPWDGWDRPCDRTRLRRGQTFRDASLISPNGRYEFVSSNGTFSLRENGEAVWLDAPSHAAGMGLFLDPEGELQLRTDRGHGYPMIPNFDHMRGKRVRWPRDADGRRAPARNAEALLVRDNGDIDLVDNEDRTLWSFETAQHVRLLRELRALSIKKAPVPSHPSRPE